MLNVFGVGRLKVCGPRLRCPKRVILSWLLAVLGPNYAFSLTPGWAFSYFSHDLLILLWRGGLRFLSSGPSTLHTYTSRRSGPEHGQVRSPATHSPFWRFLGLVLFSGGLTGLAAACETAGRGLVKG